MEWFRSIDAFSKVTDKERLIKTSSGAIGKAYL